MKQTEDMSYLEMYRELPEPTRTWIRKHTRNLPKWDREVEIEQTYISHFGEYKRPYDQQDEEEVQNFLRRFRK